MRVSSSVQQRGTAAGEATPLSGVLRGLRSSRVRPASRSRTGQVSAAHSSLNIGEHRAHVPQRVGSGLPGRALKERRGSLGLFQQDHALGSAQGEAMHASGIKMLKSSCGCHSTSLSHRRRSNVTHLDDPSLRPLRAEISPIGVDANAATCVRGVGSWDHIYRSLSQEKCSALSSSTNIVCLVARGTCAQIALHSSRALREQRAGLVSDVDRHMLC